MKDYEKSYNSVCEQIDVSPDFAENTAARIFHHNALLERKRPVHRKILVTLAAAVLAVILFAGSVYAVELIRRARMSDETMFSTAADELSADISQTADDDGLQVTLCGAFFENNRLYALFSFELFDDEKILFASPDRGGILEVDGQKQNVDYIGTVSTDGEIFWLLQEYDFSTVSLSSGKHNFRLGFVSFELFMENGETRTYSGLWDFSFALNPDALDSQTVVYTINKEILLPNGDVIILDSIVCTPLSQRLCYTVIPAQLDAFTLYHVDANAFDDKGNSLQFAFRTGKYEPELGCLGESVNILPDNFSADVHTITIDSIIISDREDNILLTHNEPITAHLCDK